MRTGWAGWLGGGGGGQGCGHLSRLSGRPSPPRSRHRHIRGLPTGVRRRDPAAGRRSAKGDGKTGKILIQIDGILGF